MAFILSVIIFTAVSIFLIHNSVSVLARYIRTIQTAARVPGFSDTRLIQGDLWVESYDVYIEKTLKFVQTTRVKMHKVWVYFFYPVYCLDHPDTAKIVLKAAVPKDDNMGSGYTILKPWIGDGLLTNIGDRKWERNRKLLTPAFHFNILKEYVKKFNAVAENLLIRLSQSRGRSIKICQPVSMATLDALLQCIFSYDGHIQELGQDHPYVSAVQELSKYCIHRMSNPMLYPDFIFTRTRIGKRFKQLCNFVHEFADDIINSRKNNLESVAEGQEQRQKDFLDIVLMARDENGNGLSDTEIRAEVDTLLFAGKRKTLRGFNNNSLHAFFFFNILFLFLSTGHDTTSSAISWCIYALAKYQDVQDKIHSEVLNVVGTGQVEHGHLSKLSYMLCFIKEVMRMYSTVPLIGRRTAEPVTIEEITLPSGSAVEINIHAINHNPSVWPDHEEFRPERFSESSPERDPFCFIPFSAGSRNCIGQNFAIHEQKVILSRLVQTYRIELDRKHEVIPQPQLVMKPKHGIKVYLRSR